MNNAVSVTVLVENTSINPRLEVEHGYAVWVDTGQHKILFDTGQGAQTVMHNAEHLGIDLARADAIVLSHGHYDHTGGLPALLVRNTHARLFLHPGVLSGRFSIRDGHARSIGMPASSQSALLQNLDHVVMTDECVEVCPGVSVTGEIERVTSFEDVGGPFYLDEQKEVPDTLPDDQALFFEVSVGIVIVLGCAHAGVINTIKQVQQLTDGKHIHAVFGGMHLVNASQNRIDETIAAFKGFDIDRIGLAHCTGSNAVEQIQQAFSDKTFLCPAGSVFTFS